MMRFCSQHGAERQLSRNWIGSLHEFRFSKNQCCLSTHRRHFSCDEVTIVQKLCDIFRSQVSHNAEELAQLANYLTPHIVFRVLCSQKDSSSARRFFTWTRQRSRFRNTAGTYQRMMKLMGNEKDWISLWQLVNEMRDDGHSITSSTVMLIINLYAAAGLVEEVGSIQFRLENFGCQHSTAVYNHILELLVKAKCLKHACSVFETMLLSACTPDMVTFDILICGLCKEARTLDAESLLRQAIKQGHGPDEASYTTLLRSFVMVGMLDDSLRILCEMQSEGLHPKGGICNNQLSSLCKACRFDEAINVLQTLTEVGASTSISYTIVIHGLCKASRVDDINKLVNNMRERGITIDLSLRKYLLIFFSNTGRVKEISSVLEECLNEHMSLHQDTFPFLVSNLCKSGKPEQLPELLNRLSQVGFVCDDSTIRGCVLFLCNRKKAVEAYKLLGWLNGRGSASACDVNILNRVLESLVAANRITDALQLFAWMEKESTPNSVSYMVLLKGICSAGKIDKACGVLDDMVGRGFVPDTGAVNCLINDFCKLGKWQDADCILRKIYNLGLVPQLATYNTFFSSLCRAGQMQQACRLLNEMVRIGLSPDVFTYGIMIYSLCKAEKVDEAYTLLRAMKNKKCAPDVVCYSTVLHGYVRLGKPESAVRLLDEMIGDGCSPDVVTYNSLISMFSKQGDTDKALQLWSEMRKKGCAPDQISYTSLLDGLCRSGKLKESLRLVMAMLKDNIVLDAPIQRKLRECIGRHGMDAEINQMMSKIMGSGFDLLGIGDIKSSFVLE